jgi:hypothetical protein
MMRTMITLSMSVNAKHAAKVVGKNLRCTGSPQTHAGCAYRMLDYNAHDETSKVRRLSKYFESCAAQKALLCKKKCRLHKKHFHPR